MSLTIQINGRDYTNWISATVSLNIETVSGAFSFTTSADRNHVLPIRVGDNVAIFADGKQVIKGFVEKSSPAYSASDHVISVDGRDVTCDFIDSTVSAEKEFAPDITLAEICRIVLDGINLKKVLVIDNAGQSKLFDDITSAEVGTTCFSFVEPYARKIQVLLNTDGKGNLVLNRASTELFPAKLQNSVGANDNNILSASPSYDNSQRYYKYIFQAQLNPVNLDEATTPTNIAEQEGVAIDDAIRPSRILEINSEESSDALTATERAAWELSIRRARSFTYEATVQGHSMGGKTWQPNFILPVLDEFAGIDAQLLIKNVTFREDASTGTTTSLEMTYRDAYTLELAALQRKAEEGEGFMA